MSRTNYALMLGSNRYISQKYRIFYEVDGEAGKYEPYFTLENSDNGLILTAKIYLGYEDLVASVDRNKVSISNDNYYWSGKIEKGEGLKLIQKDNHQVKFNVFITPNDDACVTGTLVLDKMKLYITRDFIKIDNIVDTSTIDGGRAEDIWMHDMTFNGIGDFVVKNNGFSIMARNLNI